MTAGSTEDNDIRPIEVVLFDLDGTLIDTIELILSSLQHATAEVLGESPSDEVLLHNVGVPLRVQMGEFAPGREDELLCVYRAHNAIVHDQLVCEYPGTEAALQAIIAKGYRLGIVTSKSVPVAQRGIDRFGLGELFETLVGYEDTDIHKPEAAPLLLAAQRMGVEIGSCCYVGDSPHDMNAGKAAGAVTIAALWGPFRERVSEAGPDFSIEHISQLTDVLDQIRLRQA